MSTVLLPAKPEVTRKGYFALWEEGGSATKTGGARIVCGPDGEPLPPIYLFRGKVDYARCALFVVQPGYHVVGAWRRRDEFKVRVHRIVSLSKSEILYEPVGEAVARPLNNSWPGGDAPAPQPELEPFREAVRAACQKAVCYHCRWPHFAAEGVVQHGWTTDYPHGVATWEGWLGQWTLPREYLERNVSGDWSSSEILQPIYVKDKPLGSLVTLRVKLTDNKGLPAVWESGGAWSNTCKCTLVCGRRGERLAPIFVPTRGHLAGRRHALFVLKEGYHIVQGWALGPNIGAASTIWRVEAIEGSRATLRLLFKTGTAAGEDGGWLEGVDKEQFRGVLRALREKSVCYHCRSPHYARVGEIWHWSCYLNSNKESVAEAC